MQQRQFNIPHRPNPSPFEMLGWDLPGEWIKRRVNIEPCRTLDRMVAGEEASPETMAISTHGDEEWNPWTVSKCLECKPHSV